MSWEWRSERNLHMACCGVGLYVGCPQVFYTPLWTLSMFSNWVNATTLILHLLEMDPPPHSSPSEDIIRGHPLWYIHIRKGDGPPEVEIVQTCWGSLHEVADKGAGNPNIPKSCKHHMCTPYPTRCSRVGYYSVFLFFLDVASPLAMTALVVSSVSSSLSERVMSLDSLLVSRSVWKVMGHHHCKAGIKTEGKTKQ